MTVGWLAALAVLAGLGAMPVAAQQAPDPEFEAWPGAELYLRLAPRIRSYTAAGLSTDYESSFTELQFTAAGEWTLRGTFLPPDPSILKATLPWVLRVGYRLADRMSDLDGDLVEHRIVGEATVRDWLVGPVIWSIRGGVEYRMLPLYDSWRFRPRVRLDAPMHEGGLFFNPYGSVEPLWESRFDGWFRVRYQAGVEMRVARGVVLNTFYAYQHDDRGNPRNVHGVGTVLMLFL